MTSSQTFNVDELRNLIYQNPERLKRMIHVSEVIAKDPILRNDPSSYSLSRQELIELYAKKSLQLHKLFGLDLEVMNISGSSFPEAIVTALSLLAFIPTINQLGTDEQIKKWITLAQSFQIIGCYAQTELGHGSDVQNLETTATYDIGQGLFVINSPTISSAKWWVGELGLFATHCIVQAQLVIKGICYGMQTFIVQVRDTNTFQTLPGIQVGEIGPKYGLNVKDNGFARFNQVKIPKENMLTRYANVTKEGEFIRAKNEKVAYGPMMGIRASILMSSFQALSLGVTIAVRYSLTRTQFKDDFGVERKIIEYQTQQDKIIPLIADLFTQVFGSHRVNAIAAENQKRINDKMDFSLLQDLHALLASCKAVYTWQTSFGLERLRQTCGGHGYSSFSRFPSLITMAAPACTYEGENTILLLQCARYLLKSLTKATKGQPISENVSYLVGIENTLSQKLTINKLEDLFCPEKITKILAFNAAFLTKQAALNMMNILSSKGVSQKEAWDKHAGISLVDASIAHCHYWSLMVFVDALKGVQDQKLKAILTRLCCLYGITRIQEKPNAYIEAGYIQGEQLESIFDAKESLLAQLRPDLRSIVDAFPYNENQLFSALVEDNPYEKLMEWATKHNPVNEPEFQREMVNSYKSMVGQLIAPKL